MRSRHDTAGRSGPEWWEAQLGRYGGFGSDEDPSAGKVVRRRAEGGLGTTLTGGIRVGPHKTPSPLGAGGMVEVYRARDTKLGREVAIKALPAAFAGNPDRLARFEREAAVPASLNHPNIASIYRLDDSTGAPHPVLELADGHATVGCARSDGVGLVPIHGLGCGETLAAWYRGFGSFVVLNRTVIPAPAYSLGLATGSSRSSV